MCVDKNSGVKCEICGVMVANLGKLSRHLTVTHKFDADKRLEYYDMYIKQPDEGNCKWCGKKLKLVKGSFSNGYMKFCYNTDCNVRWYNSNSNRLSQFSESFKKTLKENPQNNNSTIEYWTNKGYTEEEAKIKQSERQTTFSKEKCIERYGEEKGLEVWTARQEKWAKNYVKTNYSKISQELYWELYNIIGKDYNDIYFATLNSDGTKDDSGKNHEYRIKTCTARWLDFYVKDTHKCIEFDGTYWHGEVGRGNRSRDEDRYAEILQYHPEISIMHVNESDYKNNKSLIIEQCVEFLKS